MSTHARRRTIRIMTHVSSPPVLSTVLARLINGLQVIGEVFVKVLAGTAFVRSRDPLIANITSRAGILKRLPKIIQNAFPSASPSAAVINHVLQAIEFVLLSLM